MKHWIKNNLKNIIVTAFIIPILLVAFVSISHVTSFYGLSNPFSWAVYLSVGIEIAALSALAAVSVNMGRFVYVPFIIVTLIQFVGNLFFSFTYIDETSDLFREWMNLAGSFFEPMGIDPTDPIAHKRILAFLSGGLLPLISLTFAHMLVVYTNKMEDESKKEFDNLFDKQLSEEELDEISRQAGRIEYENSLNEKPSNIKNIDIIEQHLKNVKPVEKKEVFIQKQEVNEDKKVETEQSISEKNKVEDNLSDNNQSQQTQQEGSNDGSNNIKNEQNGNDEPNEDNKIVINEVQSEIQEKENEVVEEEVSENGEPTIKRLTYVGRNG